MWSSSTTYSWSTSFPSIYESHKQAVKFELVLYTDDTCLIFQDSYINEIDTQFKKNLSVIRHWFVDNKLNINFGEDKTKSIFCNSKAKVKKRNPLNIG